jgi:hypothetical protein
MESEFDSVMSKIMDPTQFKKQKIIQRQLRNERKDLKDKNFNLADSLRHQEVEFRTKDKLQINSNYALVGYLTELKATEIDVKLEAKRMNYLHKDKKWLIEFCNKLKEELGWCKDRVRIAEKIMFDLQATGQKSVESLIKTIDNFEAKKLRLESEIANLTRIVNRKTESRQAGIDKIEECKNFIRKLLPVEIL